MVLESTSVAYAVEVYAKTLPVQALEHVCNQVGTEARKIAAINGLNSKTAETILEQRLDVRATLTEAIEGILAKIPEDDQTGNAFLDTREIIITQNPFVGPMFQILGEHLTEIK